MTKTEILNKCKQLLNGNKLTHDDKVFLISVFKNHSDWDSKKGSNPKDIIIEKTSWGNNCFFILREDGTKTDISYIKALTKPSHKKEVLIALRYAVKDEIYNYRLNNIVFGETKCAISNEILFKDNTHIDHYNLTFNELAKNWLRNKDLNSIKVNESIDNSYDTYLLDKDLEADFIKYHNENTNLRGVTKTVNLSLNKK